MEKILTDQSFSSSYMEVQNALRGLDVLDKRTEGRWLWTDEHQSKTPRPSSNR